MSECFNATYTTISFSYQKFAVKTTVINITITKKLFSYVSVQYQLLYSITRFSNMILKGEVSLPHTTMGFT
jgi:hypothetical protein